jgi:RND family efflux transporter MFP subunit
VTAPATGVVSNRRVDPGNVIAGGSSAADVLTTIVSTNPIYFYFDASEAQFLKQQRQGGGAAAVVKIRLQDEPDYRWEGRVDFADNAIDDGSGAIRMRARIDNPTGFLKPGMFGAARVEGGAAYDALLVPATALSNDGARKVVFVVGADNKVALHPVEVGPLSGDLRVIRSGLKPTDRVIVNGLQRAQPGAVVNPKLTTITRSTAPQAPAKRGSVAPASVATPVG